MQMLERFQQVVEGVAQAYGCQAEIEVQSITPAVTNDPALTALVQQAAANVWIKALSITASRPWDLKIWLL
jgi:metal-dependent amidase/aminoacylase/carboxypeptidase family protein